MNININISDANSPYQIAKVLNELFVQLEIDRTVPPQMMYNYSKNGLIDGTKRQSQKDVKFSYETTVAFLTKYFKKNYQMDLTFNATDELNNNEIEDQEVEGQMDLIDSLVESYNQD